MKKTFQWVYGVMQDLMLDHPGTHPVKLLDEFIANDFDISDDVLDEAYEYYEHNAFQVNGIWYV